MFYEDIEDLKLLKDELLMKDIDPWDKIILVYLAYLGYINGQITFYSYKSIIKHDELTLAQQFYHCFLLMYGMININQCYRYFLLKTYQISPLVAEKIYKKFNKYFNYVEDNADNIAKYMDISQKMKKFNDYDIEFKVKFKPKNRYEDDESQESDNEDDDENTFSTSTNSLEELRSYYNIDNLDKLIEENENNKKIFERFNQLNNTNNFNNPNQNYEN